MTTYIEQTAHAIDQQLDAAKDEMRRLQQARAHLTGKPPAARRQQGSQREPGEDVTFTPRNGIDRRSEALSIIAVNPGVTSAELSRRLAGSTYGYTIVKKLRTNGEIQPCGKGWQLT